MRKNTIIQPPKNPDFLFLYKEEKDQEAGANGATFYLIVIQDKHGSLWITRTESGGKLKKNGMELNQLRVGDQQDALAVDGAVTIPTDKLAVCDQTTDRCCFPRAEGSRTFAIRKR